MKIAFLGPEGSYSHLAAQTFLKGEMPKTKRKPNDWDECIPFRNFAEVFSAVENVYTEGYMCDFEKSIRKTILVR